MVKKHKFSARSGPASGWKKQKKTDRAREELKGLEDLPLVGGLFKGLEKFIDLAEKVEEAGGEIKKKGEIKGLGGKTKGIYGFSIRTGIGLQPTRRPPAFGRHLRPKIQTFGNIKKTKEGFKLTEEREPIVDVFDEKDHILVVAELPGINEKEIKTSLKGDILILEAGEEEKRKYYKEILLPSKVDAETEERTYKNGILEIKFKKAK